MEDSKFLAIMGKLSEIGERTARTESRIESLTSEVNNIKEEDKVQNQLLAEHIQGTVANTERLNLEIQTRQEFQSNIAIAHKDLRSRVESLETLPKAIKWIKDNVTWFAIVAAGAGAILILFKH